MCNDPWLNDLLDRFERTIKNEDDEVRCATSRKVFFEFRDYQRNWPEYADEALGQHVVGLFQRAIEKMADESVFRTNVEQRLKRIVEETIPAIEEFQKKVA